MKHDQCRSTLKFKDAGQNLYNLKASGSAETAAVIPKAVESWFRESNFAAQSDITKCCDSASGKTIGHFTLMVADRAGHVGCAIASYTSEPWKIYLVACNYGFTNMVDLNVYQTGKAASECATGVNPNFKALCSTNEKIKTEWCWFIPNHLKLCLISKKWRFRLRTEVLNIEKCTQLFFNWNNQLPALIKS